MRRFAGLAALALLVASAAQASTGRSDGFVTIRAGDEVRIAGSLTGCVVQELAVVCMHQASASPPKLIAAQQRSYGTLLVALEREVILFKKGAGSGTATVFERKAKGMPSVGPLALAPEEADRMLTLRVGQVARVQGTRLDCAVVRAGGVATVYCVNDDAKGPVPGTYATLVSDRSAAVGLVAKDRSTKIVALRRQP